MALYDFAFYSTDKWSLGFASKSKIRRGREGGAYFPPNRVNCIILEQNPRILKLFSSYISSYILLYQANANAGEIGLVASKNWLLLYTIITVIG